MATQPTSQDQRPSASGADASPSRTGSALRAVVVVLVVVGGTFLAVRLLSDDNAPSAVPSSATTSSTTASTEPSPEPTDADTTDSAELDKRWQRDAVRASRAGLPAMVPAQLPEGWTVDSAAFDDTAMTWSLTLDSPSGPVTLEQGEESAAAAVKTHVGSDATRSGSLDLSKFGTGEWQVWRGSASISARRRWCSSAATAPPWRRSRRRSSPPRTPPSGATTADVGAVPPPRALSRPPTSRRRRRTRPARP